jgi:hypothetical protein
MSDENLKKPVKIDFEKAQESELSNIENLNEQGSTQSKKDK